MSDNVFKSSIGQTLMDSPRGSPGWVLNLLEGYQDLRAKYCDALWKRIEELYRKDVPTMTSWWSSDPSVLTGRVIQPPRVYSYVQGLEAQLFSRNPKFFVKPMSARQEQLAQIMEYHVNAEWQADAALHSEMHLTIRDCAKTGWAWVLSEYNAKNIAKEKRMRKQRNKIAGQLQTDPVMAATVTDIMSQMAVGPDSVNYRDFGSTYERNDRVSYNKIISRRISYWQMACDPNATCIEDAEWVARNIIVPLEYVKSDPNMKNTAKLKAVATLKGVFSDRSKYQTQSIDEAIVPDSYQYVSIWEAYIKNAEGGWDFKILADGHDQWLYEENDRFDLGCPYSLLRWNHDGDSLFTVSDVQQVLDVISEEANLRTRLYDATMREMEDSFVYDSNVIQEQQMTAITNVPGVGTMIPVPGLSQRGNIQNVISLLPKTQKSGQLLPYLAIIQQNIELGTGMGANQQMQALKSDTSATEAAEISAWSKTRGDVKHFFFDQFVADIASKRMQLACQFYTVEDIAQTTGQEGAKLWLTENFTDADIKYGLSLAVEKGTMRPVSDESRAQLYTTMLSEALQNPLAAQLYNVPEIAMRLVEARGVPSGSNVLNPAVTSDAFSQASMQMNMMAGGGPPGVPGAPPAGPQGPTNAAAVRQNAQM